MCERLGIDYAPAMVGFEIRRGHSVPVFEGLVVCEEFKAAVMEVRHDTTILKLNNLCHTVIDCSTHSNY